MTDETRPFASVCEFDEDVWIVDSPDEDRSSDVYAICRNDKAGAERIAALLNAAVQARERRAAVKALREAADSEALKDDFGHGEVITKHDVRTALRAEAAAIERGEVAP